MANLVTLKPEGKIVFVGDTHGNLDSTKYIFDKYLRGGHKIVLLGDYVDRGNDSMGNVDLIFNAKNKHPDKVFPIQGNHEGYPICEFHYADFWDSLSEKDKSWYKHLFLNLPLAVSVGDILATHGAVPDVSSLDQIDLIKNGDSNWKAITWGDFSSRGKGFYDPLRSVFSEFYFNRVMADLSKNVLIRSHDPSAPESMYGGRCVTVFSTNHISRRVKSIAIADFDARPSIKTIDDLVIERW